MLPSATPVSEVGAVITPALWPREGESPPRDVPSKVTARLSTRPSSRPRLLGLRSGPCVGSTVSEGGGRTGGPPGVVLSREIRGEGRQPARIVWDWGVGTPL